MSNQFASSEQVNEESGASPSWSSVLPTLLLRLGSGTPEQVRVARECLTQMAAVADLGVMAIGSLIRIAEPAIDIKEDADRIIAQAMQTCRSPEASTVADGFPAVSAGSVDDQLFDPTLRVSYCEAGFYIEGLRKDGTFRASAETWSRRELAQQALDNNTWTRREQA